MGNTIDQLADSAVKYKAEDLLICEGRISHTRISGEIHQFGTEPVSLEEMARFWEACGADPEATKERDCSWESAAGNRFRVNLHRQLGRLAAALRPIRTEIPGMEALGLPVERLQSWVQRPHGLILVTGATGSGKSTTMASCLDWINGRDARHIVTIEDPIEFLLDPRRSAITQREVGTDTEDFPSGMHAALRQSPDVIYVGEIRDQETARVALQASETGHLVVSTMHCSDVAETMERITALFPPHEREASLIVLANQLIGILCQKLVTSNKGDLHLLVEHLEISGAVRKWVQQARHGEIEDFLQRGTDPSNRRFLDSTVEAWKAGHLSESGARAASRDPHAFDRLRDGIDTGGRALGAG